MGKNFTINNHPLRLQLWDTAGQERFRSLIPSYLKDAMITIIVFDLTSKIMLLIKMISLWKILVSGLIYALIIAIKKMLSFSSVISKISLRQEKSLSKWSIRNCSSMAANTFKSVPKLDTTFKRSLIMHVKNSSKPTI